MLAVPVSGGGFSAASAVITTGALELPGCQVALQRPSSKDVSGSEGSLFENDAVALPEVMKLPQSSTMVTSIGVGQAATAVKFAPSWVKTGRSLVGVQAAETSCPAAGEAPAGVTTSTTATWREELSSANWITISPV